MHSAVAGGVGGDFTMATQLWITIMMPASALTEDQERCTPVSSAATETWSCRCSSDGFGSGRDPTWTHHQSRRGGSPSCLRLQQQSPDLRAASTVTPRASVCREGVGWAPLLSWQQASQPLRQRARLLWGKCLHSYGLFHQGFKCFLIWYLIQSCSKKRLKVFFISSLFISLNKKRTSVCVSHQHLLPGCHGNIKKSCCFLIVILCCAVSLDLNQKLFWQKQSNSF